MRHLRIVCLAAEQLEARYLLSTSATLGNPDFPTDSLNEATAQSYLIVAENELPTQLSQQVAAAGGAVVRTIPEIGVAVASGSNAKFADRLASMSGVQSVVPNLSVFQVDPSQQTYQLPDIVNPPGIDDDRLFSLQWGLDAINAPEAWHEGARGAGVRVAVLDTGIDTDHPDLAPNLNLELSTSFVDGEPLEFDPAIGGFFSHGTHVAGIIAAADNGVGTIGVAPEAELVHVKVLSDDGSGDLGAILNGIVYATQIDADVINLSLGSFLSRSGSVSFDPSDPEKEQFIGAKAVAEMLQAVDRATSFADRNGTLVIAAAGNAGIDLDHSADWVVSPADLTHVLSVAATGPSGWALDPSTDLDVPASYTNFGRSSIDFAAPGGDRDGDIGGVCSVSGSIFVPCWAFDFVLSANADNDWTLAAGTSMAAPHVAGVAALVIGSQKDGMAPNQVERILRDSAVDIETRGQDPYFGSGRIDALEAVLAANATPGHSSPGPDGHHRGPATEPPFHTAVVDSNEALIVLAPYAGAAHVSAGDATLDGKFDQRDIVAALQAAKYVTGQPAAWSEGDWNGDGVFNQLDIVAALQTGNYLQGPYAAAADAESLAKPTEGDLGPIDDLFADIGS